MWHLTCTQHAACRDSCDNPILVNLLRLLIGATEFLQCMHQSILIPTGFVSRLRKIVVYRAFAMLATVGCKLLSGCLKCCGASSVKGRFFLIIAMLVTSSWSAVLPWLFDFFICFPKYSTLKIFPAASFSDDVGAHDLRSRSAAFGRNKWGDGGVEVAMGHHRPAGFGCRVYSRNPLSID